MPKTMYSYYNSYKQGARTSEFVFELDFREFEELVSQPCFYCGAPPRQKGEIVVNNIDRYDNDEGFTLENCVPSCPPCNQMKYTLSGDDFLTQLEAILEYQVTGRPNMANIELPKRKKEDLTHVKELLRELRVLRRQQRKRQGIYDELLKYLPQE